MNIDDAIRFAHDGTHGLIAAALAREVVRLREAPAVAAPELRGLTDDEAQAIADQFAIDTTEYVVFRIWGIAQSRIQSIPADHRGADHD